MVQTLEKKSVSTILLECTREGAIVLGRVLAVLLGIGLFLYSLPFAWLAVKWFIRFLSNGGKSFVTPFAVGFVIFLATTVMWCAATKLKDQGERSVMLLTVHWGAFGLSVLCAISAFQPMIGRIGQGFFYDQVQFFILPILLFFKLVYHLHECAMEALS